MLLFVFACAAGRGHVHSSLCASSGLAVNAPAAYQIGKPETEAPTKHNSSRLLTLFSCNPALCKTSTPFASKVKESRFSWEHPASRVHPD